MKKWEKISYELNKSYYSQDLFTINLDEGCISKFSENGNLKELIGGVVYFIHMLETPYYKIGISHSLSGFDSRMMSFKTGIPFTIDIITVIELEKGFSESASFIEKFLHKYFKHKKKNREWFEFTEDEVFAIYSFLSFDLDILDYQINFELEELL